VEARPGRQDTSHGDLSVHVANRGGSRPPPLPRHTLALGRRRPRLLSLTAPGEDAPSTYASSVAVRVM
jgi:hypothetical protein